MGKTEEYVVKGAMAMCNGSTVPMIAQLSVIADNLFNKINGNLFATTGTMGPCFGPVPFGTCKLLPPTPAGPVPCACAVLSWSGAYDAIKINKVFNPLLKSSKGQCVVGGSITFKMSGQFPKPTVPSFQVPNIKNNDATACNIKRNLMVLDNCPLLDDIDDISLEHMDPNVMKRYEDCMGKEMAERMVKKMIKLNRLACFHYKKAKLKDKDGNYVKDWKEDYVYLNDENGNPIYHWEPEDMAELTSSLDPEELNQLREATFNINRELFPKPVEGEIVTKLVSGKDFKGGNGTNYYLGTSTNSSISGCIGKKSEYSATDHSIDRLIVDFGMDYEGSAFVRESKDYNPDFTYVKIECPATSELVANASYPKLAMDDPGYPQTFDGTLGHPHCDKLTPEYHGGSKEWKAVKQYKNESGEMVDVEKSGLGNQRSALPNGSTATAYDENGNVVARYVYVLEEEGVYSKGSWYEEKTRVDEDGVTYTSYELCETDEQKNDRLTRNQEEHDRLESTGQLEKNAKKLREYQDREENREKK